MLMAYDLNLAIYEALIIPIQSLFFESTFLAFLQSAVCLFVILAYLGLFCGKLMQGLQKIRFIVSMLELDIQPMFSDLDVIWLKNPLPFVAEIQEPNILVSSDSCQIQQNSHLDNCSEIMGTNKHVEGEGNFVGVMNVSLFFSSIYLKAILFSNWK